MRLENHKLFINSLTNKIKTENILFYIYSGK